jgi:hypothetical protein
VGASRFIYIGKYKEELIMSKRLIKNIEEYVDLYRDDATGIAWIENGKTGGEHSVHPNIDKTGSISGMKKLGYWKQDDEIVRVNGLLYNISKFVKSDKYDEIVANYCNCEECKKRRGWGIEKE